MRYETTSLNRAKMDSQSENSLRLIMSSAIALLIPILLVFFLLSSCQKHDVLESQGTKAAPGKPQAVVGPAVNGVMMQGFYWNVPQTTPAGSWWQNLGSKAAELSQAGITAVWIPPAYKGGSVNDVGYGVYDRYDLGEFNQKGTIPTRYGTLSQLQGAITQFHNNNIQVYADIVMNHFLWADYSETINGNTVWTGFSYSGRGNTYSSYKWNSTLFNGYQGNGTWYNFNNGNWDFTPYYNGDAYDNLMGCDIKYNPINGSPALETINWGNWITTKLNLDGYRLDATKHIYTPFVNSWLDNVKGTSGRFAVGEAWLNNVANLNDYAAQTGGRMSLFDVPLHYMFNAMSNANGGYNMANFAFAGFTEANGPLSVSFVDNHDTDDNTGALYSPVTNLKMLAYAYILTREKGYPCVYYRDYYEYGLGAQIKKLIEIRKANGYGSGFEYTSVNDGDVYAYSRAGDATHAGMLVLLNDGSTNRTKTITTPFKSKTLTDKTGNTVGTITTDANGTATFGVNARSYAVWVPTTGENPPTVLGTNFVVNFKKPSNWGTNIRVYYWNQVPALATYPAWPGTAMTSIGNSWYSFTFSGVNSTSIIFNDGTNQTADLTRSSTGWYSGTTWTATNPDGTTNAAPVLSVNITPGTYPSTQTVTLSATDDSGIAPTIYYTIDGSTPTTSSASASGSKVFTVSATTTIKAMAVDNLGLASAVSTYLYTINIPVNTAPTLSVNPAAGTYTSTQTVTLTATDNSGIAPTIYYTTDGSTPTTSSLSASGSKVFTVSATTTIKAFAVDNLGLASAVSSYTYTITPSTGTTAVTFKVTYSGTQTGQSVYIVGNTSQLGQIVTPTTTTWTVLAANKLATGNPWYNWSITLNLPTGSPIQYKYVIANEATLSIVTWEPGANKSLTPSGLSQTVNDTW